MTGRSWRNDCSTHAKRVGAISYTALAIAFLWRADVSSAQETASVSGAVRSATGAPAPGIAVAFKPLLTGDTATTTSTDSLGRFRLSIPSETNGDLTLSGAGFKPERARIPALPAGGSREVAIVLSPLFALDAVTVVAVRNRPLLDTRGAATGGSVEREELAALPADARDPLSLAFTIPGVAQSIGFFGDAPPLTIDGANSLYTEYSIDGLDNNEGFLGGPRVEFPLGGISRLSVLANTYGSEWGRSSNGVVNVETRAGSDRWRGEVFAYNRPGIPFDAKPAFTPPGVDPNGFKRTQAGFSIGGPAHRDKTFFFGTAEYTSEREDRIGSTARAQFLGTELRNTSKWFARLDHGWSPTQTSTVKFALSDVSRAGQGGGLIVPEADITTRRIGSLASLSHLTSFRSGDAENALSVQLGTFHWYFPPTRSNLETPQVTIVAADSVTAEAVVGSSNFVFDERERQLQIRDIVELRVAQRHSVRMGGDVTASSFRLDASSTSPRGAYTVIDDGNIRPAGSLLSITDIPSDVRVLSYTVDANPQKVDLTQALYAAFIDDDWRVTPSLTLNLGLRWDYDDITSRGRSKPDLNNFQPRVSFNWYRTPQTVIRGGAGLYTGKFPYAVYSDAIQFGPNGNAVVTFKGSQFPPPAFMQGPSASQVATLRSSFPPREIRETFALGLQQPESRQLSIGFQRQLGETWTVALDGVLVDTRHLPRSWDLNPDARPVTAADSVNLGTDAGDAARPVRPVTGSYRRLTTTESGGRATYRGLLTTLRRRVSERSGVEATWVWSRARNNTEDINFNASHANDYDAEWADAINDRRHRISVRGFHTILKRLRLGGIADFQTGTPINRIAFFRDLDGSGDIYGNGFIGNYDRFAGVPRNGERLASSFQLGANSIYELPVGRGYLEFRADVFNLLNTRIVSGFVNGIPGGGPRTQVGRPGDPVVYQNGGAPRQVQLSARYVF